MKMHKREVIYKQEIKIYENKESCNIYLFMLYLFMKKKFSGY